MLADFEYGSDHLVQAAAAALQFDQVVGARWNTLMENGSFRWGKAPPLKKKTPNPHVYFRSPLGVHRWSKGDSSQNFVPCIVQVVPA